MDVKKKRRKINSSTTRKRRKKKRRTKQKETNNLSDSYSSSQLSSRKRLKKKDHSKEKNGIIFLISFCLATLICLVVFFALFQLRLVKTDEMAPSISEGSVAILSRQAKPRRNNIVVVKGPAGIVFTRVIGIPNDTLMYEKGTLIINGVERLQPYVTQENQLATEDFMVNRPIPEETYYVLGDNRISAVDSRTMGLITKQQIIGVLETLITP